MRKGSGGCSLEQIWFAGNQCGFGYRFKLLGGGSFGKENKNGVRVFLVVGASLDSEVVTVGKGKGMRDS